MLEFIVFILAFGMAIYISTLGQYGMVIGGLLLFVVLFAVDKYIQEGRN